MDIQQKILLIFENITHIMGHIPMINQSTLLPLMKITNKANDILRFLEFVKTLDFRSSALNYQLIAECYIDVESIKYLWATNFGILDYSLIIKEIPIPFETFQTISYTNSGVELMNAENFF